MLALDLVNTVVCRSDPLRRADRFDVVGDVESFAAAAARHRAKEVGEVKLTAPADGEPLKALLALREAVDGWLRPQVETGTEAGDALARLFSAAANCTSARNGNPSLNRAAAISAMRLFDPAILLRTKICPNCDWLFIDRSKNRSRLWCDMAVCGNRSKARAHYRRKSAPAKLSGAAL